MLLLTRLAEWPLMAVKLLSRLLGTGGIRKLTEEDCALLQHTMELLESFRNQGWDPGYSDFSLH